MSRRLSRLSLISYGLGSAAPTAATEFCGAFLLIFYTEVVGLDPIWVGYAMFVRMWVDALVDPSIGYLSDRTSWRSGRRRPYFLLGGLPGLACFLMTYFPPQGSMVLKLAYLTIVSTMMAVFLSMNAIPHMALAFELSDDARERTRLVGYRSCVESAASLLALLSGPIVLGWQGQSLLRHVMSRADCYRAAAAVLALIAAVSSVVAYLRTKELPCLPHETQYSFVQGIRDAFRNSIFRLLLLIYVVLVVANRVALAQLFLLLEHFHGLQEAGTIPLLLSFYIGALVSLPAWIFLGVRWGRERVLFWSIFCWPLTYVFLAVERWSGGLLCGDSFLMGASFSGVLSMLGAIAPDALDYDRQTTGLRREGLYASTINLVLQLGIGIGYLATGMVLQWIGFRGTEPPSEEVIRGLRYSVAGFPVLLAAIALLTFERFRRANRNLNSSAP